MPNITQNSDLISRASFEQKLQKYIGHTMIGQLLIGCLWNEPAVEAKAEILSRWDATGRYIFPDSGEIAVRCENCGCALHKEEFDKYIWNFCPVCGATMQQEKE